MSGSIRGLLYRLSYLLPFAIGIPLGIRLYTAPEPAPPRSVEPCNTLRVQFDAIRTHWSQTDPARIDSLIDAMTGQRETCMRDPAYSRDLSLAMQFDERWAEGRALFEQAARDGFLAPDGASMLAADIGLDEARWLRDAELEQRGPALVRNAETAARALLLRWPEWREAQSVYHLARMAQDDYVYALPPASNAWTGFGRWARERESGQAQLAMIALGFFASLMAGFGLRSISRRRLLECMPLTPVVQSMPGYVHLQGRLHGPPGADPLRHPRHGAACIWYPGQSTIHNKKTVTLWHGSTQPVVLRDGTGEVLIEFSDATVETPAPAATRDSSAKTPLASLALSASPSHSSTIAPALGSLVLQERGYFVEGDEVQVFGRLSRDDQVLTRARIRRPGIGQQLFVLGQGLGGQLFKGRLFAAVSLGIALTAAILLVVILHEYLRLVPTPWDSWTT